MMWMPICENVGKMDAEQARIQAMKDAFNTMVAYGYKWMGMRPLMSMRDALTFRDRQLYALYPDNTESAIDFLDDLNNALEDGLLLGVEYHNGDETCVMCPVCGKPMWYQDVKCGIKYICRDCGIIITQDMEDEN